MSVWASSRMRRRPETGSGRRQQIMRTLSPGQRAIWSSYVRFKSCANPRTSKRRLNFPVLTKNYLIFKIYSLLNCVVIPRTKNALFMVQVGGTEYAIVQIVPAKPAIRLSQALFTHGDSVPGGLQIGGSLHSISVVLGSSERPPPTAPLSAALQCRPQSDRKRLRQAQGACAKVRRTNPRCTRSSRSQCVAPVQARRMRKVRGAPAA